MDIIEPDDTLGYLSQQVDELRGALAAKDAELKYESGCHSAALTRCTALKDELAKMREWAEHEQRGREKAEEDRTELRSEVAKLREALEQALDSYGPDYIESKHSGWIERAVALTQSAGQGE